MYANAQNFYVLCDVDILLLIHLGILYACRGADVRNSCIADAWMLGCVDVKMGCENGK